MAIPYLGIAGGLLVGAAITGLASRFFGGRETAQAATNTTSASRASSNQGSVRSAQRPTATQRPTYQASSSYSGRPTEPLGSRQQISPRAGTVGVLTPTTVAGGSVSTLATSTSLAGEADDTASNIQSLPVFTPTAPEPVTTTTNYQSTKRLEVQKSKAGEQTLRNPLDKDKKSSAIKSGLPSIGVASSDTAGISTTFEPVPGAGGKPPPPLNGIRPIAPPPLPGNRHTGPGSFGPKLKGRR